MIFIFIIFMYVWKFCLFENIFILEIITTVGIRAQNHILGLGPWPRMFIGSRTNKH